MGEEFTCNYAYSCNFYDFSDVKLDVKANKCHREYAVDDFIKYLYVFWVDDNNIYK